MTPGRKSMQEFRGNGSHLRRVSIVFSRVPACDVRARLGAALPQFLYPLFQPPPPCLGRDLPSCLSSSFSTTRPKRSVPTQLLVDHRRGNFFRRHLAGHPERGFQAFNFRSGRNVSASQDLECQVQSFQRAHRDSNMPHLADHDKQVLS